MSVPTNLVTLASDIVENEGHVGARGATLELARGYLALAEAYEFDCAIPLEEAREAFNASCRETDKVEARENALLDTLRRIADGSDFTWGNLARIALDMNAEARS